MGQSKDYQKTITFNRWSLEDVAAGNHTLRIYRDEQVGNGGHRTILYDGRVLVPENSIVTASLLRNKSLDMNVTPKRTCGLRSAHPTSLVNATGFEPTLGAVFVF